MEFKIEIGNNVDYIEQNQEIRPGIVLNIKEKKFLWNKYKEYTLEIKWNGRRYVRRVKENQIVRVSNRKYLTE